LACTWQSLNHVFASGHTHDGHSRYFSYPALKVSVIGGDYVDFVLHDPIHNAVICVNTFVVTLQAFPALVSGDSQSYSVSGDLLDVDIRMPWGVRYLAPSFSSSAMEQLLVQI
jgi:hypothetical protein